MIEYDFKNIKGWTEDQINNGEYHDYNNTFLDKKGYRKKKIAGGHIKYSHWIWNRCYGYIPDIKNEIHHKDLNQSNDNIENLVLLTRLEHAALHGKLIKGKSYDERFGIEKSFSIKKNISEKTKNAMSKIIHPNLGKHLSESTKEKISQSLKGKMVGVNNPFYGKKHKIESLEKMSNAKKGKPAWNSGLSLKEERPDISESLKMAWKTRKSRNEKNPFAGKQHSEETKKHLSEKNTKHKIGDVWLDAKGILKYKDLNGKNRRLPNCNRPEYINKEMLSKLE